MKRTAEYRQSAIFIKQYPIHSRALGRSGMVESPLHLRNTSKQICLYTTQTLLLNSQETENYLYFFL